MSSLIAGDTNDVTRMVADRLADPLGFWSSHEVANLRDDEGAISEDKVNEVVEALLAAKPHYAKPEPPRHPDLHQGVRGTAVPPQPPSFGEAAQRAIRGG